MVRTVHVRGFRKKDGSYVRAHTREIRGPPRKARKPDRTIFFPSKSPMYAEIVDLTSTERAGKSVDKLLEEFNRAQTRAKRRKVKRVAVLAANRASVMAKNPRLHPETRREKARIEEIYRKAANRMVLD